MIVPDDHRRPFRAIAGARPRAVSAKDSRRLGAATSCC